jgi:DMSO/TMAO reductase YedYZ molybdopterin-dependent catalytic subunit
MDGEPLSHGHGFPARVVMPRMYGYKSVKWVTRIEARTTYNDLGYWEQNGYDKDAWIGASNGF